MPIPAPFTDQQIADHITRDGMHWDGDNIIYYAFPSSLGSWSGAAVNEFGLSATQRVWVELVFEQLEELFDLDFIRTTVPNNPDSSDITDTIRLVNDAGNGTYSQSWTYSDGGIAINNVVFDSTWSSNQDANLSYGSYGFLTMIHEILHSLGLEHPGDYNAGSGGPITYQNSAEFEQDTHRYSVMSYFSSYEDGSGAIFYDTTTGSFVYPRTPMVYDILAMTSGAFAGAFPGYGENSTTRNTDTTYGYNATSGINEAFDFDAHGAPVLTIYDTGGIDTLDLSGDTVSVAAYMNYDGNLNPTGISTQTRTETLIDLREGAYSSTHGMTYNIGIAFGTVIENAIGTGFNDTIYGNDVANRLEGGDGNDSLYGYRGLDTLLGGAGADFLIGGGGADFLDGGSGADRLLGGNGNDTIVYDAADDWAGGDVNGGNGFDTLLFELVWYSVDLLAYGFEQSALHLIDTALELWDEVYHFYNVAEDLFESDYYNDDGTTTNIIYDVNDEYSWDEWHRTYDSDGNLISEEFIDPSPGSGNVINGTTGDDTLDATSDPDDIDGDAGEDWINYAGSTSGVDVNLLTGNGSGGHAEGDTYTRIENIHGSVYADTLTGDNSANTISGDDGNDTIDGEGGDDTLVGGDGDDTINGGSGDDFLEGGAGADQLDGGADNDWADYQNSSSGVTIRLFNNTASGGDATGDTLSNIENLIGSDHADTLIGDSNDNTLDGRGGNDTLIGRNGNDLLIGGEGDDVLQGRFGNDTLRGGAGADRLDGGDGNGDWADYQDSGAGVNISLISGTASGGDANGDVLLNIENLQGSDHADSLTGDGNSNTLDGGDGNDYLNGRGGADTLVGGAGADTLEGRNGNDTLDGGTGDDILFGGRHSDTFVFEFGDGDDVIRDFEDGLDLIDIQGTDFGSLTIYADGSDTIIEYGSDTIRLENIDASLIDADDFVV